MTQSVPIIFIRADASLRMGAGHVMRCLTLAGALRKKGLQCRFICRPQTGDLIGLIRQRGYLVHALAPMSKSSQHEDLDSEQTLEILRLFQRGWVVVDHYDLGERWERQIRSRCRGLFVIDDLADRMHDCDVLMDQNLGRLERDYLALVPAGCRLLIGPRYALLRPEFAANRAVSLQRRTSGQLGHVLISLGGADADNVTSSVIAAMQHSDYLPSFKLSVVLGRQSPWVQHIRSQAAGLPWVTDVLEDVGDMAALMSESDLAIGGAGGTAYERCCLGLPSVLVILAENQRPGAMALARAHAAALIGDPSALKGLPRVISEVSSSDQLMRMSAAASAIVDGIGADRICQTLGEMIERDRFSTVSPTPHDGERS
jgi:UDP-2,4-diacetamido-2,4,6-trideoxy-beta-L-altropyranose hydrolase